MTDDQLLRRFEDLSLPFGQWTHRAHIRVAFLYPRTHPFEEALRRVRAGIKAYNAANSRPDGPLEGYNETTTAAFLRLVDTTMRVYEEKLPTADSEAFCDAHPQLLSSSVSRLFYSPAPSGRENSLHRAGPRSAAEGS
ncbi:MAG: hypothetical protein M3552_19870 [Planctomycetota bacterium]|nr:hypothetical protein [Planctomycetota bacterium]